MSTIDNTVESLCTYYIGYAAISFRQDAANVDIHRAYVLNYLGDTWFRRDNTSGKQSKHGLCVQNVKVTSRNPVYVGDFIVHKAKIDYIKHDETMTSDFFWIYVHKQFDIQDVLNYIETNKSKWIP